MVNPVAVFEVPFYGCKKAFFKGHFAFPAQLSLDFCTVYGVALVVTGSILYIGDCFFYFVSRFAKFCGSKFNYLVKQLDVLPFVFTADIVFFAGYALVYNEPYCAVVIFYINPVADVIALAVNRKIFSVTDVGNHKRQQFFRELIWSVVVCTVAQSDWETVGVIVGHYNVV